MPVSYPIGAFKPFSLAEAVQAGQAMRMNRLKIQQAEMGMGRNDRLRGLAQMSTAPVYGPAEGPPEPRIGGGAQIQTGEQFSPEAYQQNLAKEGFVDESMAMQDHISKMNDEQRKEAEYRTEHIGRVLVSAKGNPAAWDQGQQEAINNGWITPDQAVPYSDQAWQMAMDSTQKMKGLLATEKPKESLFTKIDPSKYTTDSIKSFEKSGSYSDLVPVESKSSKPPKIQTFTTDKKVVQARWVEGAPDVGFGEGMVPITERDRDTPLGQATLLAGGNAIRKEYNKQQSTGRAVSNAIESLRSLLDQKHDAFNTRAIQTKLTEVFSTSTKAIAEVDAWGNRGSFVQRIMGGLSKFTSGDLSPSQYKMIRTLIDKYDKDIVKPGLDSTDKRYRGIAKAAGIPEELMGFGEKPFDKSEATDKAYDGDNEVFRMPDGTWRYEDGSEYGK